MIKDVSTIAGEIADREAIRDCIIRYCRGQDRADMELIRSGYWSDGYHDHGIFKGGIEAFLLWIRSRMEGVEQTQHSVSNVLINISGAQARVESSLKVFLAVRDTDGTRVDMLVGVRYLDVMERRHGEWRAVHRVVIEDWVHKLSASADTAGGMAGAVNWGRRDEQDLSYAILAGTS